MAKDPVCNMDVDEKEAQYTVHFDHETYYFCSKNCQKQFEIKMGLLSEDAGKSWWQRIGNRFLKAPKEPPPKCH